MTADFAAAEIAAKAAIARGTGSAQDHATLGWAALDRSDDAAAAHHFQTARTLDPHDGESLLGLANINRRHGHLRDAVLQCDAALALDPNAVDAWLERGHVLSSGGSMTAAAESYRRVISLDAQHPAAHAGLAALLARDGQAAAARTHAGLALAQDPGNPIAAGALAAIMLEEGETGAARNLLAPLVQGLPAPSSERALLANQLGNACAQRGDAPAAYAAYRLSKTDFAALHANRFVTSHPARDFLIRLTTELAALEPASPVPAPVPAPAPSPVKNHVFLMGFPRSGTTLVENILASLPGVLAVEELPTLGRADQAFLAESGGLAHFSRLADAELTPFRTDYWARIAQATGGAAGHALVDMDPLKGSRLPLIARLFPQARIVLMRRDPRDVVWSCFHTHFALTNAAMDFTSLDSAARYYAAMMTFIDACTARLDLNPHIVRYEALVTNFADETRRLCDFAGLPWTEALLRFDRTARRRGVATASAGQVRKGLYDGSGQWRPFAEYLAPIEPILAPWIERFGYTA